jgi:CubicO group peptidase (beta-lactamase class C family)
MEPMLSRTREWPGTLLRAVCASALIFVAAVDAAPPKDLDRYAQHVLDTFQAPGMVVTIAEVGQPSVVRGYGVRRLGEPARVDAQTLFAIGSTTKAFTSALLAMLVDEGKLTWDTKVSDVLPGFKLYDPYASSEMTVRDLLVHRSGLGLGAGDLMFYPPTDLSRADIVRQLRYIKPATSFRSGFAYDNLLYIAAGQVIEALRGSSWEDVVRQRIFVPLQMDRASVSSVLPPGSNRAWPHARISTEMRGDGPISALERPLNLDNAAPAGALNVSGQDMARWLELQLGRGLDPRTNRRLYSEAQAREMWSPQTLMPIAPRPKRLELAQPKFSAYALGWGVSEYRGHLVVSHGGGVPGMVTTVVIVPERDVAFAVMTNAEDTGVTAAMQYRLLDHFLGLESPDWPAAIAEAQQARLAEALAVLASGPAATGARGQVASGPSLPLAQYAGKYRDDWYGGATIDSTPTGLNIRFEHTPSLSSRLEHVRYDTFRTRLADRTLEDAYVSFALNPDGTVAQMTLRAVSPLADFSFDYQDLHFKPVP